MARVRQVTVSVSVLFDWLRVQKAFFNLLAVATRRVPASEYYYQRVTYVSGESVCCSKHVSLDPRIPAMLPLFLPHHFLHAPVCPVYLPFH